MTQCLQNQLELQRFRDGESAEEVIRILKQAQIPFHLESLKEYGVDLTYAISRENPHSALALCVPEDQYHPARAALEAAYADAELPEDHYLPGCTDQELQEILAHSPDWSALDVAQAKRLLRNRGVQLGRDVPEPNQPGGAWLAVQKQGKPVAAGWIVLGCLLALLGLGGAVGIIGSFGGIGIGWSISNMQKQTPYGPFFIYDERSRKTGHYILLLGGVCLVIMLTILRPVAYHAF